MRTFFDKFGKLKQQLKSKHWDIRVSDQVRQERLDICNSCDKFNSTTKFCTNCICHIPSKSLFYYSECPLDKWPINDAE